MSDHGQPAPAPHGGLRVDTPTLARRDCLRRAAVLAGAAATPALLRAVPASRLRGAGSLTVWFSPEGAKGMRLATQRFTRDTGIDVAIEVQDSDAPSKFQQAAAAGKGPDMMVFAHDRVGEWVSGGLLHPVAPSRHLVDDIDPLAWQGFTQRGRRWGYPLAIEAITLVYNRALVPTPPTTFDEVFALDAQLQKSGKRAILWDYTNTYFTFPLMAAHGGYAFKPRADGGYDGRDTGVANPGALVGARLLERLLREGLMPVGSGYPEMEAAMAQGRVAMMINGPWSWVNLARAGIDFGVAKIPTVDGKPAVPFVGIKGIVVNRSTKSPALVTELIENYLLAPEGLRDIDKAEPLGAPASRAYFGELGTDARIAGIMASARDGLPTPGNPEMGRFWAAMKSSLTTLSEGRQNAQQAMDAAARRILG